MASIKNYVNVGITIEAARLAALGFNKVLFLFESDALDRSKVVSTDDYDDADLGGDSSELYKAFQTYLSQPLIATEAIIGCKKTADATWAAAIAAIREEQDDFYGIVLVSRVKEDIESVAAVNETLAPGRILFAVTSDTEVLAGTAGNVALSLSASGYYRTALTYSSDTDKYANAAQAAYLSYDPGSFTFNYKELVGVKSETLTADQRAFLIAANCQCQTTVAGLKRLFDSGMVASGEWIDIILGMDWLTAQISEGVFAILGTSPKVPMTNPGMAVLGTEVKRNLVVASEAPYNFIDDQYSIVIPDVENFTAAQKAARQATGFKFTAYPQGAVHGVAIVGKLVI